MVNYNNSKVYKISNNVDNKIYIGVSTMTLSKIQYKHKLDAKKNPDRLLYSHIFKIGWNHVKIVLIEKFPCDSRNELYRREKYWIKRLKPALNSSTIQPRVKPHKKSKAEKMVIASSKHYREKIVSDTMGLLVMSYRKANSKNIRLENKKYYQSNRERKVKCECGSMLTKHCLARHKKTQKHLNSLS
jgi:hypothetical protein